MPKLDGKEYSYDKAGMSAFNKAKMKKNSFKNGGLIETEQKRVARKYAPSSRLGEALGSIVGFTEKLPKKPKPKQEKQEKATAQEKKK